MVDYTNHNGQAFRLRELALEAQSEINERNALRHHAYLWLAVQPQGQLILDDLALTLLKPCMCPEDEGERRMVLKIFKAIEMARTVGE